ncbi:hypothetical protein HK102_012680 [Quaeritorhiza haematococci]|nr:hypothetical protein HK102_012680 [Quaeritorhiza haematococci]
MPPLKELPAEVIDIIVKCFVRKKDLRSLLHINRLWRSIAAPFYRSRVRLPSPNAVSLLEQSWIRLLEVDDVSTVLPTQNADANEIVAPNQNAVLLTSCTSIQHLVVHRVRGVEDMVSLLSVPIPSLRALTIVNANLKDVDAWYWWMDLDSQQVRDFFSNIDSVHLGRDFTPLCHLRTVDPSVVEAKLETFLLNIAHTNLRKIWFPVGTPSNIIASFLQKCDMKLSVLGTSHLSPDALEPLITMTSYESLRALSLSGFAINDIDSDPALFILLEEFFKRRGPQLRALEFEPMQECGVELFVRVVDLIANHCHQLEWLHLGEFSALRPNFPSSVIERCGRTIRYLTISSKDRPSLWSASAIQHFVNTVRQSCPDLRGFHMYEKRPTFSSFSPATDTDFSQQIDISELLHRCRHLTDNNVTIFATTNEDIIDLDNIVPENVVDVDMFIEKRPILQAWWYLEFRSRYFGYKMYENIEK